MEVTLSGIVTLVRLVQDMNASSPMEVYGAIANRGRTRGPGLLIVCSR